ncbi:MAG TPA: tRNA (adenosine(37)-N6)-threonylcarbamoyltransferase complex dimerization subunit type 1 TsaB [Myxococcales bacterium]|jgi:tRNA threonylcarbamoyladenosine biosynthesis protein TsaB
MLLLALDTATLTLSAALVERAGGGEDRVLDRRVVEPPTAHSSVLPGLLDEMLTGVGKKPGDLAAVVVGLGPGSFTGLRISLATAKGLCYAAQRPLLGASSLEAMALAAAGDVPEGTLLVPCLDARKGEVYAGFFRKKGAGVALEAPEAAVSPEALLARVSTEASAEVYGIGRAAYPALAGLPPARTAVRTPDAAALVRQIQTIPEYSAQALFALEPHYVRPSDSEWTSKPKKK